MGRMSTHTAQPVKFDEKSGVAGFCCATVDAMGAAKKDSPVPVILITYATSEDAVYRALEAVQRDKVISGRPQVIRIEKN